MDPLLLSGIVLVAVTVLIGCVGMLFLDSQPKKIEDRLQVLTTGKGGNSEEAKKAVREAILRETAQGFSAVLSNALQKYFNIQLLLEQADVSLKIDLFFALSGLLGMLGLVAAALLNAPPPLYPVAFIAGAVLPLMWVRWKRNQRFAKFGQQLPDAMELLSRALRSGNSLAQGIKLIVDESPAPLATEFAAAYEEQNLGHPLDQALKRMLRRMPNMDLKFFVTAVVIQRQAGGDLSEILDKIGYIIRERFKILGTVMALTGEGRISGIVLMALPIAIFVAVYYLNPEYVSVLFTDPLGRKMIAVAAFLQVVGAYTIKKIVTIKI